MGILEQLREQANQKQQTDSVEREKEKQRAINYQQCILPKMQEIFSFVKELVEYLNYLEPAIKISRYSTKYPQFRELQQKNYKLNTDGIAGFVDTRNLMQINISFSCSADGIFCFRKDNKQSIEETVNFFNDHNLKFSWNYIHTIKGASVAMFKVHRYIPVRFRFEVDHLRSRINLLIDNHQDFNSLKKSFVPEAINEVVLDEIARYLLRKDHDFIYLDISKQQKQDIHQRFKERQLKHTEQKISEENDLRTMAKAKKLLIRTIPRKLGIRKNRYD